MRPTGGFVASKLFARRFVAREKERENVRLHESTAEEIEKRMTADRQRRQRAFKVGVANPFVLTYQFFANPVLRFWCLCNVCCAISSFASVVLFMLLVYPMFRSITKCARAARSGTGCAAPLRYRTEHERTLRTPATPRRRDAPLTCAIPVWPCARPPPAPLPCRRSELHADCGLCAGATLRALLQPSAARAAARRY